MEEWRQVLTDWMHHPDGYGRAVERLTARARNAGVDRALDAFHTVLVRFLHPHRGRRIVAREGVEGNAAVAATDGGFIPLGWVIVQEACMDLWGERDWHPLPEGADPAVPPARSTCGWFEEMIDGLARCLERVAAAGRTAVAHMLVERHLPPECAHLADRVATAEAIRQWREHYSPNARSQQLRHALQSLRECLVGPGDEADARRYFLI